MKKVLLVDDDVTFTHIIERFLTRQGFAIYVAHTVRQGIQSLRENSYDLLLLDYRLPDGTGFDMLSARLEQGITSPAIMMTSFDDVRTVVKAMRLGAFEYITKPVHHEELQLAITSALSSDAEAESSASKSDSLPAYIEGVSLPARKLKEQIKVVAPTSLSVIIQGESGTGKENVARTIHALSSRANKPFVAIDCGALSEELAGSELFGHIKGAFTGALQNKTGRFVAAHSGTLFLDEVGNLSYAVQIKLLRALQEKVIQPIGSHQEVKTDVRVIVATNEDLLNSVQHGRFRDDLYHRLNEFKLIVPPLRERDGDLPLFIDHFIQLANKSLGRNVQELSPAVQDILFRYDWPGNLRELNNVIKRLVLLSPGTIAEVEALPEDMLHHHSRLRPSKAGTDLKAIQEQQEKILIESTLRKVRYNKSKAARLLNIDRSTLYAKMEKYQIKSPE
jgi:two-component system response regulator HydG